MGWGPEDRTAVEEHFARLEAATLRGEVIMAGGTTESCHQTFGLEVFEAANEAAARDFMLADPTVVAGVMTAEIHPYEVAGLRGNPSAVDEPGRPR